MDRWFLRMVSRNCEKIAKEGNWEKSINIGSDENSIEGSRSRINKRFLVYVGEDLNSSIVITPAHFLCLNTYTGIPKPTQKMPEILNINQQKVPQRNFLSFGKR